MLAVIRMIIRLKYGGNARDPGEHKDHVLVRKTLVAGRPWELSDNVTVTTEQ